MTVPIYQPTGTGSSSDIVSKVKRLIPNRWFSYVATQRDAILGGLADISSWCYALIYYARSQTRLSTAYGIWLDIFSYDYLGFYLPRNGMIDDAYRKLIKSTILQQRVTRAGMISAITTVTGNTPWIFEPNSAYDCGAYSAARGGTQYGTMGYGVGQGGYGNMALNNQTFIRAWITSPSGIPVVGGYSGAVKIGAGGYNGPGYAGVDVANKGGAIEYAGSQLALTGVTQSILYNLIAKTKPTGNIAWVAIGAPMTGTLGYGLAKRPAIMNSKADSQNVAVI
jgi:hypothetical protein